jgi:hypothetical protein
LLRVLPAGVENVCEAGGLKAERRSDRRLAANG